MVLAARTGAERLVAAPRGHGYDGGRGRGEEESVLSELATSGRITLSFSAGDGPPTGGAMIHDIEDDLCE
jgi:hypothetical protein